MSHEFAPMQQGLSRLQMLRPNRLCQEGLVKSYLASTPTLKALVADDGACFIATSTHPRIANYLLAQVRYILGTAEQVQVSPIAIDQWLGQHKSKAVTGRSSQNKQANDRLNYVIHRAIDEEVSDIYLDIGTRKTCLSFRKYGFKHLVERYDRELGLALARSMWAQASTGNFEETVPCDCAFSIKYDGREYRVRVNSLPDVRGPNLVCRVRDPEFTLSLDQLGYSPQQAHQIKKLNATPNGLLLITGETNSGKSTTLTGLMEALPKTQKIIEIADPIEVYMDHVTHVELNRYRQDAESVFSRVQASLVRQNPDTLILGEIRDRLTADAAASMAIQGKSVYSTLHSPSCLSAIPRLEQLGIAKELLGLREFLVGIVSQNLAPIPCSQCCLEKHKDPEEQARYRDLFGHHLKYINSDGCRHCFGGVIGQTLVAEVYPFALDRSAVVYELINRREYVAIERHMKKTLQIQTKHQHAAEKIMAGIIPPPETEQLIGEFHADQFNPCSHLTSPEGEPDMPQASSMPFRYMSAFGTYLVFSMIALLLPEIVEAKTGNLPWESPLETLQASLTGPVAMAISVMGIAVTGGMLIWGGELNDFTRRVFMLILAISFLVGGAGIMDAFFPDAAGAVLTQAVPVCEALQG